MRDNRLVEMRVFRAIVENNGFTAAAHALNVSQPFVSRTIASLERRLGVKLLHRTTRGRRLTPAGEQYMRSAETIMVALHEAEGALCDTQAKAMGDVHVSAAVGFGIDRIVPLLPSFLEKHPDIKLHLSLTDTVVNLIEEDVDVAIRLGRLEDSTLIARRLCVLRRLLVAAPAYLARAGTPSNPYDLANHNCLEWQGKLAHLNHWQFRAADKDVEIVAKGNFRSSEGLTLFQMCVSGVGIMRLAEHLAVPAIRSGQLVHLMASFDLGDEGAIQAVYLPERRLLPRVRLLVEHLAQAFDPEPWTRADDGRASGGRDRPSRSDASYSG